MSRARKAKTHTHTRYPSRNKQMEEHSSKAFLRAVAKFGETGIPYLRAGFSCIYPRFLAMFVRFSD
ncbi:MAG: hypothetical protein ACJARR_003509 [Pseudophaeobacter arcticus]|jgi:hypothetical protein